MVTEPLTKDQTLRCVHVCASFMALTVQLQSILGGERRHNFPNLLQHDALRMAQMISDAGLHPEGGSSYEQAKALILATAQKAIATLEFA